MKSKRKKNSPVYMSLQLLCYSYLKLFMVIWENSLLVITEKWINTHDLNAKVYYYYYNYLTKIIWMKNYY